MADIRIAATAGQSEPAIAGREDARSEPYGPRPRRIISKRNIVVYGTLFVRRRLLPAAALRDGREPRLKGHAGNPGNGHIFAPPWRITFELGWKAWAAACNRVENCERSSRGFWNSVAHHRCPIGHRVRSPSPPSNGYA